MSLKEVVANSKLVEWVGYMSVATVVCVCMLGVLVDILGKLHKEGSWKVSSWLCVL